MEKILKSFPLFLLILSFLTIKLVQSDHLYSYGVELNYNNAGYATEFRLAFSFSSHFSSTDYIKLIFPFALHSSSTNSIPDNLSGYFLTNNDGFHCGASFSAAINIFLDDSTANSYFIQMLDSQGNPNNNLSPGIYYTLVLVLDETNANIQSSGVKPPVQLFTVSDKSSNAIIYDSNTVFATFALNEYPSAEMQVSLVNTAGNRNEINAIYNITMDLTPKKTINDGARFQIKFLQSQRAFTFTGACESVARTTTPVIDALDPSIYQCFLDSNGNLILSVNKTIEINMGIRLQITVMNPGYVQGNTSIEVRSLLYYINTIVEISQTDAVFYTEPLTFSYVKLFLAWGLDTSLASYYPFSLNVIRGDKGDATSSPVYYPYNSFKWKLKITQSINAGTKLKIILKLPSPENSMILTGSIAHNFPSFSNTKTTARCYVLNPTISRDLQIICDNVAALSSSTEYFIGCRMYFPYDQWTQPLNSQFGSFIIYSFVYNPNIMDTYALFQPNIPNKIQTSNNPSWFIPSTAGSYDKTMVSTEDPSTASPNDPQTNILGVESSTTNKRLVFSMNMMISDVYTASPAVVPPAATPASSIPFGSGLIILTNPSVYWDQVSNIAVEMLGTPTGGSTAVQFQSFSGFNKITVSSTHTSQLLAMFAYDTSVANPPSNYFSLSGLMVKKQTSLYADDEILDFYIASFELLNTAFPAFRKLLIYNAYTITTSWNSQIRYAIVNYWATSTANNAGSSFPTFLRLAGYFESSDLTGFSGKLAVFFNDLNPFPLYSDTSVSEEIACFSTVLNAKCRLFSANSFTNGQSYHNLNRVELDFSGLNSGSTAAFELLIPVATVANKQKFNIFLGVLGTKSGYSIGTYYSLLKVVRLTGGNNLQTNQISFAFSGALGTTAVTAANYGLDVAGLVVGQTAVDLTVFAGHTDGSSAISANSGLLNGNNGAGFTLSSSWNFTSSSSAVSFSLGDATTDNKCLSGKYIVSWTNGVASYRYTIFCPYVTGTDDSSSKITITNGKVPYSNGDKLPSDTSFAWATNTGKLVTYSTNPSSVIPSHSALDFIAVLPPPKKGFKQNYLQWNFKPVNAFLDGFIVKIVFSSPVQFFLAAGTAMFCELKYANGSEITSVCSASLAGTTLSYLITSCSVCPLNVQALQINHWGITNPDTNGADVGFYLKIFTSGGNLVETSTLFTFTYDNSATETAIILTNLEFSSLNKRARGNFEFTFFMNGREIWKNDYLAVNLGGVAKDNAQNTENIRCKLLETNRSVSKRWISIDLTDLTSIPIVPKANINETNSSFTLFCEGVITPFSYNPSYITMYLEIQGTSSIIKYGDAFTIDDNRFLDQYLFNSISALLINKYYNSPGSALDLIFNFTCANQDIDMQNTNFIMDFPVYYSPYLSNNMLLCQIDSIIASCMVLEERRLLFTYIPKTIAKNTQFQLRVYGVDCPSEFISGSAFFFGVLPNSTSKNLSQFGYIADISPNSLPTNIQIYAEIVSNLYIRSYSTYSFKVNFPAGSISSTRVITIDFPIEWDLIIYYDTPACQVYNPDLSVQFASNCTGFANKLTISLSQSDVESNFYYLIVLNNVRNPDYGNCDVQPFIISVSDLQKNVVSRSHSNQINKNVTSYMKNPDQINLAYIDISSGGLDVFQADIGVFNKFIRVFPEYGIFAETLTLTSNDASLDLYPSTVTCKFGETSCDFSISAKKGTLPGLYNLEVVKSENFDLHTRLPFLKVRVSSQTYSLNFEANTYDLPIGGKTLPILLNFDGIVPNQDVKIDAKMTLALTGTSFIGQSSILINSLNTQAYIRVQADASKTSVGTDTIQLQKSGTNSENYNDFPNLVLNIYSDVANNSLNLEAQWTSIEAVYANLQVSCGRTSTFYYAVALNGSIWRNSSYIQTQALSFTQYNYSNLYQEQFGFVNLIQSEGTLSRDLVISQLFPNMSYNFTGFCQDLMGRSSDVQTLIFQTRDNAGKLYKIVSSYSISISSSLIASLGCFLNKLFKIPARNIRTIDDTYCSSRRLLQTTSTLTNTSSLNTTLNETNSTTNASNVSSTNLSNQSAENLLYEYSLYIYPSDDLSVDVISPIIQSNPYNNVTLMSWILGNVTGMPSIQNISDFLEIDRTPPNLQRNLLQINASVNSIELWQISLDKPGMLYVSVEPIQGNFSDFLHNLAGNQTLFELLPNRTENQTLIEYVNENFLQNLSFVTWVQVRTGLNSANVANNLTCYRVIFNNSEEIVQNITYSNLFSDTFYMISAYVTADDPSFYARRSPIFQWIQNTTAIERLTLGKLRVLLDFLTVFAVSIAACVFF